MRAHSGSRTRFAWEDVCLAPLLRGASVRVAQQYLLVRNRVSAAFPLPSRDLLRARRVTGREVEDVGEIGGREARLVFLLGRAERRPVGIDLRRPVPGGLEVFSPGLLVRCTRGIVYVVRRCCLGANHSYGRGQITVKTLDGECSRPQEDKQAQTMYRRWILRKGSRDCASSWKDITYV